MACFSATDIYRLPFWRFSLSWRICTGGQARIACFGERRKMKRTLGQRVPLHFASGARCMRSLKSRWRRCLTLILKTLRQPRRYVVGHEAGQHTNVSLKNVFRLGGSHHGNFRQCLAGQCGGLHGAAEPRGAQPVPMSATRARSILRRTVAPCARESRSRPGQPVRLTTRSGGGDSTCDSIDNLLLSNETARRVLSSCSFTATPAGSIYARSRRGGMCSSDKCTATGPHTNPQDSSPAASRSGLDTKLFTTRPSARGRL